MGFDEIAATTLCPYAPMATWREWRLDLPDDTGDAASALGDHGRALRAQIPDLDRAEIDMVALELTHPAFIGDLDSFTDAVRAFIAGLHAEASYDGGDLGTTEEDWLLVVDGVRLFALAFAPFYGPNHPRHSPTGSAWIVIQFLFSFRRIGLGRMTLAAKRRVSDRVRSTFEEAGMPYFAAITQDSPEVLKLIKPLHDGDPPARWWRQPPPAAGAQEFP